MISKQQLERLRELVNVVAPSIPEDKLSLKKYWCGSVGCIAGHATFHPSFIEEGFCLEKDFDCRGEMSGFPAYEEGFGRGAVQEFFGLTDEEDKILYDDGYSPSFPPTKENILANLRKLLQRKEDEYHEHISQ